MLGILTLRENHYLLNNLIIYLKIILFLVTIFFQYRNILQSIDLNKILNKENQIKI